MVVDGQGVKSFLTHLATRRQVSAGTQNQAFSALVFLCREVLRLPEADLDAGVRAKASQRLPAVLSTEETARLLNLPAGSPGLLIERRAFLADGRVVESTRSFYRGDAYDFVAELHSE